jgi:hypothetical protein
MAFSCWTEPRIKIGLRTFGKGTALAVPLSANKDTGFSP